MTRKTPLNDAKRRHARAGLTLVEILVAVALLGVLSAGLLTLLETSAGAWSAARERLTLDRRVASSNTLLHAAFAGVVPLLALPPPQAGAPQAPFFHGEPGEMRFVSSYSMTEGVRGGLRILELNVQRGPNGLRLVLTESPYRGPLSVGRYITGVEPTQDGRTRLLFTEVRPREDSLIVADALEACTFSYLRAPDAPGRPSEWTPVWDDLRKLPEAVRVELQPEEAEARLQPVSITAEIRAQYAPPEQEGPKPNLQDAEVVQTPRGPVLRRREGPR